MTSPASGRYELPSGTDIDGRYRIDGAPLGVGGMATVYPGVQLVVGREVAIKVLRPDLARQPDVVRRFLREARAGSVLQHPNVVTVHDYGVLADGTPFLVMERVAGRTLGRVLREEERLSVGRAVHVAVQVLCALEEAHGHDIVHRDLKPDNVFLTPRAGDPDFAQVLDFGLARVPFPEDADPLTATGEVFGTPAYISPEQARGLRCDHRADLYALGVVMFECLTGSPPFQAPSNVALLVQHLQAPPPPLARLVPELAAVPEIEAVVQRALAKDPGARHPTAREMRLALQEALGASRRAIAGLAPPRVRQPTLRHLPGGPPPVQVTAPRLPEADARGPDTLAELEPPPTEPVLGSAASAAAAAATVDDPSASTRWMSAPPAPEAQAAFWQRERRRNGLVVAIAIALAGSAVATMLAWPTSDPAPPEVPVEPPPPATTETRDTVALQIEATPAGAVAVLRLPSADAAPRIERVVTPARLQVPAGADVEIRVEAPDHLPHTLRVRAHADRFVTVQLDRVAAARPPSSTPSLPPRPRMASPGSAPAPPVSAIVDDLK